MQRMEIKWAQMYEKMLRETDNQHASEIKIAVKKAENWYFANFYCCSMRWGPYKHYYASSSLYVRFTKNALYKNHPRSPKWSLYTHNNT